MYRPGFEGATVGFDQATFEMRVLLRNAGLEVSIENNQYADHVGIELLYTSALCGTCAQLLLLVGVERCCVWHSMAFMEERVLFRSSSNALSELNQKIA